ncbi:ADP-ribosylglycohydrolase family protein [Arthrobacter cavernae]|uniref:ADP-ribosylglycohydrolase family protein n=1 Tax=Arthrobacter cavernae TaxID=2817681 RepID=A0A939HBX6_9MICC|nr:ADP-ribosylglycohydrolase family protein [Arthrobacter cavernae]MBO1266961.1 ADP-ribosylglycohydrolase family protein [Arthrobacter cavernae]
MSVEAFPSAPPSFESRVHGCLLGGALGDSLGYAVEFDGIDAIRERFGAAGLTSFGQLDGGSHFSDDTQMTLYTVDGLVEALEWANDGVAADELACLWLAYLRWLATQDVPVPVSAPVPQPRWIDAQDVLRHRRAPGNGCLSGLSGGTMGTVGRPVNPESKGCGTVMRSAPFGLIPHISREAVYKLSSDAASLTHGHPSARLSAAAFSLLIHHVIAGSGVREAASEALSYVSGVPTKAPELPERLEAALALSAAGTVLAPEELTAALGDGWVAEEALAVGLYAVLSTEGASPAEHFRKAIGVAVNHSGDSDSTASIAGNILGALYGEEALPADWLQALEGPEVIRGMAERLLAVTTG